MVLRSTGLGSAALGSARPGRATSRRAALRRSRNSQGRKGGDKAACNSQHRGELHFRHMRNLQIGTPPGRRQRCRSPGHPKTNSSARPIRLQPTKIFLWLAVTDQPFFPNDVQGPAMKVVSHSGEDIWTGRAPRIGRCNEPRTLDNEKGKPWEKPNSHRCSPSWVDWQWLLLLVQRLTMPTRNLLQLRLSIRREVLSRPDLVRPSPALRSPVLQSRVVLSLARLNTEARLSMKSGPPVYGPALTMRRLAGF